MAWKIELSPQALKNFDQLDQQIARRILKFLHDRLAPLDDHPRSVGDALRGSRLGEFWKYKVGDYCIITSIEFLQFSNGFPVFTELAHHLVRSLQY